MDTEAALSPATVIARNDRYDTSMREDPAQVVERKPMWPVVLRWIVCIAAVAWIVHNLNWAELKLAFALARWDWIAAGVVAFGPVPVLISQRLRWLLEVHAVRLSLWQAIKVTFAGNFLIQAFPVGTPGGDSAKAWYIARDTPHKHEAALAVFFDRVLGTIVLLLLSGTMILLDWDNPAFARWGRIIGVVTSILFIGGIVYYSRSCRKWLRLDEWVSRLPLAEHLQRLDRAMLAYRNDIPRVMASLVLTLVLQFVAIFSLFLISRGLGMAGTSFWADFRIFLAYTPICFLAGALPIGAMELTFAELFSDAAQLGSYEQALSLSFFGRLLQLAWALPGALVVLQGRRLRVESDGVERSVAVSANSCGK